MNDLPANAFLKTLKFASDKSKKTAFFIFFPATLVLFMLAYQIFSNEPTAGSYLIIVLYLIISGMLVWMWFDTGYEIRDNEVYYHSGVITGKINIAAIRKIEKKKELFGGLKPALGTQGIIVHYNKFDDIYFSPENQEAFVQEIKARNPQVEIIL